jgi:hypothetical protein
MNETYAQNQTALRRPVGAIQQESEERKQRISTWMGATLIITALSIDAFQALLNILLIGEFVSPTISVCADVLFVTWFWMLGVSFTKDPRAFMSMAAQAIIGLIPILNTLPELTLGIIGVVVFTKMVDKSAIIGKAASAAQGKIK